jgi:tyrosine-protein kinase Etk/Wzc
VRNQIRQEATKIVHGLENQAEVANARETSLRSSLNEVQSQTSGQSDAEIKLRVLEREAKANRDSLESYLARFRDASARHDMAAVPANATIVSHSHVSSKPSFPKRGPISALSAAATALLALAFVLSRELIEGTAATGSASPGTKPQAKRHKKPSGPVPVPAAPEVAPVAAAAEPAAANEPVETPRRVEKPMRTLEQPKQDRMPVASSTAPERSLQSEGATVDKPLAASAPVTRGLFDRVLGAGAASTSQAREQGSKLPPVPRTTSEADAGAPNDLRSYLQRRAALQTRDQTKDVRRKDVAASSVKGRVRPVLRSLDAVLNHVHARSAGNPPRVVLVVPVLTDVDATVEAIRIARALLVGKQRTVLVDLTRGAAAVSGRLGLPRAPGFTDLAAGRADFEHVVHVDEETPLQVIPAGNPTVKSDGDDTERTTRIFEALAQAYDCIVLHANRETARKLKPALDGRLQVVVAVLAPGEIAKGGEDRLAELTAFDCLVVLYEQADGESRLGRSGLFGRAAAI